MLSLGEQQLLVVINILLASPQFVFLDRIGTALDSSQVDNVLRMFTERSISYVNSAPRTGRAISTTQFWSAGRMAAGHGR
jgi:ABC-type uncharacterized transport system fused permease/ATPase subunit